MNLITLLELAQNFTGPSILTDNARCLNQRHPDAQCTLCVESCPTQAITVHQRQVALDAETCTRCGACLWRCPNGAFTQSAPPEARLMMTASQQDDRPLELVCPAALEHAGKIADAQAIAAPRCLVALSPAMLISLAEGCSTLWLNDLGCHACPMGAVHAMILDSVAQAAQWIALYERAASIKVVTADPPQPATEGRPSPVLDGAKPAIGRRAFLHAQLRDSNPADVQPQQISSTNPVNDRLTYRLPPERVRLLQQEAQWMPGPSQWVQPSALGLAGIEIDESACSLCGWCAGFCPTAALEWHQTADRLQVTFRPLRCIDCTVCQAACPSDAVHKLSQIPSGALRQVVLLAEGEARKCRTCGRPTAVATGEQCIWCEQQLQIASALKNSLWDDLKWTKSD